jgi:hypothetical protein
MQEVHTGGRVQLVSFIVSTMPLGRSLSCSIWIGCTLGCVWVFPVWMGVSSSCLFVCWQVLMLSHLEMNDSILSVLMSGMEPSSSKRKGKQDQKTSRSHFHRVFLCGG